MGDTGSQGISSQGVDLFHPKYSGFSTRGMDWQLFWEDPAYNKINNKGFNPLPAEQFWTNLTLEVMQ